MRCVGAHRSAGVLPCSAFSQRAFRTRRGCVVGSVPSLLYAGMLMTEVALYPSFVLAFLAIAVALERPTAVTQVAVSCRHRTRIDGEGSRGIARVRLPRRRPVFHWLDTRRDGKWLERLRAYWPTWLALATMGLVGFGLGAAAGKSPTAALGTYEQFLRAADRFDVPRWMFFHLAAFDSHRRGDSDGGYRPGGRGGTAPPGRQAGSPLRRDVRDDERARLRCRGGLLVERSYAGVRLRVRGRRERAGDVRPRTARLDRAR